MRISVDRKSIEQMKFDRRLVRRKEWITRDELEKRLEALPDVSHKIAPDDDAPSEPSESPRDSPEGDAPEPDNGSDGPLS